MTNRVEKGLAAWQGRQQRYASIFGEQALSSRAFARIRLQEMRALYRNCRPPKSMDERVSLKMLKASNKSLERRLYPNRVFRVGRRIVLGTVRAAGSIVKGIAAMMQDNPAAHFDMPAPKRDSPVKAVQQAVQPPKIVQHPKAAKPRVVRLQPRVHPSLPDDARKSRGISR